MTGDLVAAARALVGLALLRAGARVAGTRDTRVSPRAEIAPLPPPGTTVVVTEAARALLYAPPPRDESLAEDAARR